MFASFVLFYRVILLTHHAPDDCFGVPSLVQGLL